MLLSNLFASFTAPPLLDSIENVDGMIVVTGMPPPLDFLCLPSKDYRIEELLGELLILSCDYE